MSTPSFETDPGTNFEPLRDEELIHEAAQVGITTFADFAQGDVEPTVPELRARFDANLDVNRPSGQMALAIFEEVTNTYDDFWDPASIVAGAMMLASALQKREDDIRHHRIPRERRLEMLANAAVPYLDVEAGPNDDPSNPDATGDGPYTPPDPIY